MKIKLVKMAQAFTFLDDSGNDAVQNPKYKDFSELLRKYKDTGKDIKGVAEKIIVACIFSNRYAYDGYYHQYGEFGAFVFEDDTDGEQYIWCSSMRYFGELMAKAWNILQKGAEYSYVDFYIGISSKDEQWKVPNSENEFCENRPPFESVNCTKCGKMIDWDEFAINFEWCSECLDKSYGEYLKEENKPQS